MLKISSFQNPKVKRVIALQKSRERKKNQAFLIEGVREISLAQQAGYQTEQLFLNSLLYTPSSEYPVNLHSAECIEVSGEVFERMAYRESTGGIIAIAKMKPLTLDRIKWTGTPLFLILEQVEKPGNIGAVLRTADAAGLSGVIICDPATDFYNPNVIRSSIGCLFTVPVASAGNEEVFSWLKNNNIRSFATLLSPQSKNYTACDYTQPSAFLMGAESTGLSEFWKKNTAEKIIIPMHGKIDSMNVSNAAAICIYEAIRQRRS